MTSKPKPNALIIGRDASLGTALADWLRSTGVNVTFADVRPAVTPPIDLSHANHLAAPIERTPPRPEPVFDQILWIVDPPPEQAMGAATAQEAADAELHAHEQIIGQAFMGRPFQLVMVCLHVPADPKTQPELAHAQEADRMRRVRRWRSTGQMTSDNLKGAQAFLAYVAIDPAGDLKSPPTRYHRLVANLLGRALAAHASLKDVSPFRFLPISRLPDGDPLVGETED